MTPPIRRRILLAPLASLAFARLLHAQPRPAQPVDEAGEQAIALGYRHDTTQVDAKKYPKHASTQHCANCSFWQGQPADPWGGCAMFGRKQVANAGWCEAWAKAAG